MGMYDTVLIPCPKCGTKHDAQSKSGICDCITYEIYEAPVEVLGDINRHAPFVCDHCGAEFKVVVKSMAFPVLLSMPLSE